MPKIAANLTMMFNEFPFAERIAVAAKAGFKGVEYLFPYDYAKEDLAEWNEAAGVEQVLINCPAGDWANGERGTACIPGRENEFRDGVGTAIEYALALKCPRIHLVAGLAPAGGSERVAHEDTYRANIAYAGDELAKHGLIGLLETLNSRDVPGFLMNNSSQVLVVLQELDRQNLKLQFDVYHVQIMEGDISKRFDTCLDQIGHVQIANPPLRHEPDNGELNYDFILQHIDDSGYDGWVACEYIPAGDTLSGLKWGEAYGLAPSSDQ